VNIEAVIRPDVELLCDEPGELEPSELWASELLEAGLTALIDAELTASVPAALLAAELMDAGLTALVASEPFAAELAAFRARQARRPSRAPRRA
jgi:hypothetical protein